MPQASQKHTHTTTYVTNQNIKNLEQRIKYEGDLPPGVAESSILNYFEELETVSLVKWEQQNSSGRITENDLRVQLGIPKRGWY